MLNLLMERMGQRLLQDLHWPDTLELAWRLSYSQGDGCAIYGELDSHSLLRLLPHLAKRQGLNAEEVQQLAASCALNRTTISLTRNAPGHHYSHSRCITTEVQGLSEMQPALSGRLYQALIQDIALVCITAERLGYQLLQATTPQSYNDVLFSRGTQHFEVRAVADAPEAIVCDPPDMDVTTLDYCLDRSLLHGARLLTVRLDVICHTTGDIIAQQWLPDVLIETDDRPRHWLSREAVRALMQEAREAIYFQTEAFQSFHHAA